MLVWRKGNINRTVSVLQYCRLVVLKSGLGLKCGLKSTFAGLGLGLEIHGLELGLGLRGFFQQVV